MKQPTKDQIRKRKYYLKHRDRILKSVQKYWFKNHEDNKRKQRERCRERYKNDAQYREKTLQHNKDTYRTSIAWFTVRNAKQSGTKKQRARIKLSYHVRVGNIKKPNKCDSCKVECIPHGHHHRGYDKPLDVLWLCRMCHGAVHRKP